MSPDRLESLGPEERAALERERLMSTAVAETAMSVRIVNALEDIGILLVGDLMSRDRAGLLAVKNFGERTLNEVVAAIVALGVEVPRSWLPPRKKPRKRKPGKKRPRGRR